MIEETKEDRTEPELHEHPVFNGSYHQAVWIYQWTSSDTTGKPPSDCPIVCAICGRVKK